MKEQGALSRREISLSSSWGCTKDMNLLRKFRNKEPFLRLPWKETHWSGLRALWKESSSCCALFLKDCFCNVNQQDQNLRKFLQGKANLLPIWDSWKILPKIHWPQRYTEACWCSFAMDAFTAWHVNCYLLCHSDESICYFLQLHIYISRSGRKLRFLLVISTACLS